MNDIMLVSLFDTYYYIGMSDIPSLLYLFDNMDKDGLLETTLLMAQSDDMIPLQDILEILEETIDIEIVAALIELLMVRVGDVDDQLMMVAYPKASDVVKRHIVMVLGYSERSKYMQFLLGEYFYNPYMRPVIRKNAFENKKFLFMNLVRYFEAVPFNSDNVQIAQQILTMIPRDVILSCVGVFTGAKLMDVYYAMPVEDRERLDQ
jgi:hypothetical protein